MNSRISIRFLQAGLTILMLLASLSAQAKKELRARDLFLAGTQPADATQSVGAKSDKTVKAASPLGLRYSIVKQVGGESVEVDPESVFRSGDRIRLNVQANDNGYLYIVLRGSSGRWSPLFPSKEILSGDNRVKKGGEYEIPLGSVWFAFDEQPGTRIVEDRNVEHPRVEAIAHREDCAVVVAEGNAGGRGEARGIIESVAHEFPEM